MYLNTIDPTTAWLVHNIRTAVWHAPNAGYLYPFTLSALTTVPIFLGVTCA